MSLSGSKVYYLVESSALPEVYHKVIKTKELLESGQAATVSEAVAQTGAVAQRVLQIQGRGFHLPREIARAGGQPVVYAAPTRARAWSAACSASSHARLQRAHAPPGAPCGRHGHLHRVCRDAQRHHVKRRAHRPAHHGQGRARMQGSWQRVALFQKGRP